MSECRIVAPLGSAHTRIGHHPPPKEKPMPRKWAARGALVALDSREMQDRRELAKAQAEVTRDVAAGHFPTWSALEALAVAAPTVALWDTLNRLHRVRVLDSESDPDTAPSRLEVLRDEAGRVLDSAVRYVRLSGSASPAGRLAEQGDQMAELTWARQILDTVAALGDP
jgi:hypothetical protein